MAPFTVKFYETLLDYSSWGRDRILATAEKLTEDDFTRPCGLDYPSIRATLVHQLASEMMLLGRWRGETKGLTEDEAPTLDKLRDVWSMHEADLRSFTAKLSDADLTRSFEYKTRDGDQRSELLWQSMFQLANHGTQHRSEIALALTQMGHSPGFLDFVAFVRESGRG